MPGCDISGVVEAVGHNVTRFAVGDKIASIVSGAVTTNGAYAEYVLVEEGLALKIPDGIPSEEASALGVAVNTASLVFYSDKGLGFKVPSSAAEKLEGNPFVSLSLHANGSFSLFIDLGSWRKQRNWNHGYSGMSKFSKCESLLTDSRLRSISVHAQLHSALQRTLLWLNPTVLKKPSIMLEVACRL